MIIRNLKSRRRLAALAVFAIVALSAFGFAAANTVPASKAGDGAGAITGYAVSNVHYNLNATDPRNIDSVTFHLDSAPAATSTIKITLTSGGSVYTCSVSQDPLCATTSPQATVLAADQLRVVAVD